MQSFSRSLTLCPLQHRYKSSLVLYFLPFQFNIFLFESIDQDLSNSPQPLSKEAGRLGPVKRKTKNRNTETAATTNTNSEIDDPLSQLSAHSLARDGWLPGRLEPLCAG